MTRFNPLDVRSALVAIPPPTSESAWIEHVQKACVNFGGASGAFVSPRGLVLKEVARDTSEVAVRAATAAPLQIDGPVGRF